MLRKNKTKQKNVFRCCILPVKKMFGKFKRSVQIILLLGF